MLTSAIAFNGKWKTKMRRIARTLLGGKIKEEKMSEDWSFKKQLPQPETKKIKAECPVCHSTDHIWIQWDCLL